MKRFILGVVLGLAVVSVTPIQAATKKVNKLLESSLMVRGKIVVAPDGSVQSYAFNTKEGLNDALEKFLDNAITHWRFKPVEVDGKIVTAEAPMAIRLIVKRQEDGSGSVRISSTWFGKRESDSALPVFNASEETAPRYPLDLMRAGVGGYVYLVIRVGRDGKVMEAEAERVNLLTAGSEKQMKSMRSQFAEACTRAAKKWTYTMPTTGPGAERESWVSRITIGLCVDSNCIPDKEGKWATYIADPEPKIIPWLNLEERTALINDAAPPYGFYPMKQDLQLLTPPST